MIENFLTIPDAPNYEINSQLVCRNRKTKKLLTLQTDYKNFKHYSLRVTGSKVCIKRSPRTLRNQAVDAANPQVSFEPIPSLDYRYEINERGKVRNAQSKQILKTKSRGKCVNLHLGERKFICRCVADLLWEVHGRIPKRRFRPCPCSAENDTGKFFFPNMKACARFLAPKLFFSVGWIAARLNRREPIIDGWKITYYKELGYEN